MKKVHRPNRRLTEAEVIRIRRMWEYGEHTQHDLAKIFGCGVHNIRKIVHYVTWKLQ